LTPPAQEYKRVGEWDGELDLPFDVGRGVALRGEQEWVGEYLSEIRDVDGVEETVQK
jgi:hypothetical protein